MAETGAYLCDQDLLDIGESVFAHGAALVPDERYAQPTYVRITSTETLTRKLKSEDSPRLWFVVSPAWERSPLEMDFVVKEERQIYYVRQKNGGPSIDIYYPRPFGTPNGLRLRPGYIAYHREFWNPVNQRMEAPPPELVEEYKRLRTFVARGGRRIREAGRSFIVTKNVDQLGAVLGISD
jgi:hypothetical protein